VSIFDHPAHETTARATGDAVTAAAFRLAAQLCEPTSVCALHDAENDLVVAVTAHARHVTDAPGQWRGPGVYSITVSDEHGAAGGRVACRTVDELAEATLDLIPLHPDRPCSVLAVWDGPILGTRP